MILSCWLLMVSRSFQKMIICSHVKWLKKMYPWLLKPETPVKFPGVPGASFWQHGIWLSHLSENNPSECGHVCDLSLCLDLRGQQCGSMLPTVWPQLLVCGNSYFEDADLCFCGVVGCTGTSGGRGGETCMCAVQGWGGWEWEGGQLVSVPGCQRNVQRMRLLLHLSDNGSTA